MSNSPSLVYEIIPIWFSPGEKEGLVRDLLHRTLADCHLITEPENRFLYVDGVERLVPLAQQLIGQFCPGAHLSVEGENRGKGAGIFAGLRKGLKDTEAEWFVVRDADGDHLAVDFPHMKRLGEQISRERPHAPAVIIGGRSRLEPPLTFYRSVYENLLNAMLQNAVHHELACRHSVQDASYFRHYGSIPDIQSGYKLYNRKAAQCIIDELDRDPGYRNEYERWGAEIPTYVWCVLNGGIVGETRRATMREQPVSAYNTIKRAEFYARKIAWVFRTCNLSLANSACMMDNELTCHPLIFDSQGRDELLLFRQTVLESLSTDSGETIPPFSNGSGLL